MIKTKKQMFIIIGLFTLLLFLGGTAYAWFNYRAESGTSELIAGDIYLVMEEGNEEIELSNIFPETAEEARARNDNFITFDISGLNDSSKAIYYEIILDHGTDKASPKTRYRDRDLKFDLIEIGTNNEETYLLSAVDYDSLVNQRIYVNTIPASSSSEVSKHYKLRMWLSEDVTISDTDPNATYNTTEYRNKYASVKVVVAGDFVEKEAPKPAYNVIAELSGTKSYIASYDDIISSNPTFTTHDQVSDSATKQTVYYYTGNEAAANSNVLFAGYCWQIVRTTDNGGVRMIYNGVAQKPVTASTPISNTDITATNDGTYAYTYDSTTKKWTSANAGVASSTDTFIFTVNTAGDYAINYKVSSQANNDYAKIYIKPIGGSFVQQAELSGEMEGTFDLGTLSNSTEVKIAYIKDYITDTGDDNLIFDIASVNTRGDTPACAQDRRIIGIKGINQEGSSTTQNVSAASLYGRSFDYNLETGEFTIEDSTGLPTAWSMSDANNNGIEDYKELIGTYTCLSSSATCTMLYYVGSYYSSTTAFVSKYTIGDVARYSQMGRSAFNSNNTSLALVGYMFNTEYDYKNQTKSGEYYTTATWNGTTYDLTSGNGETAPDATHRYICDTDCTKVRYYYIRANSYNYYILLENGATVEDAIYKMTGNGTPETKSKTINANYELNNYNSSIKGYLDNWYKKNLTTYASYLDNTSVYCNDRSIRDLGGWNPSGTSITGYLQFYQYIVNRDLNCVSETDRFAVTNNKAKLTYPIGLLTEPERYLMTATFAKTGQEYLGGSPYLFDIFARVRLVDGRGDAANFGSVGNSYGARGVVTLKPGTKLENGTGTYLAPYIVGPIVDRNS